MLLLVLALVGQNHQEILWTTQKGLLERWVDASGIDVRPLLVDYVNGKVTAPQLSLYKKISPTPTEFGSYLSFEKTFSGTPKWTCVIGTEIINAPRIYGLYEDDLVYIWGRNFQDLKGNPPKVYLVTDKITELTPLPPPNDLDKSQAEFENPYILRLNPPTDGRLVVYTGELGLWGCDWIQYTKRPEKTLVRLTEASGIVEVPPNTIYECPYEIEGAILKEGAELRGATIRQNKPYLVRMFEGCTLKGCHLENWQPESCLIQVYGRIRLEDNTLNGYRGCTINTSKPIKGCVILRNKFSSKRTAKTGPYFPVGSESVLADNLVEDSYRGIIVQANNGPVNHNLILRNEFEDGGFDKKGGEQIIFETKATEYTPNNLNPKVGETVMITDGEGKGRYSIFPTLPKSGPTSIFSVGNIATENLLILNRIKRCRVGVEFWKYSVGNICVGLQCYNVKWGYIQNCGKEHGYAFHNELRDSFFEQSPVALTSKDSVGHMLNFKLNRVEFIDSPLRSYRIITNLTEGEKQKQMGEGLFMFKCEFGLHDTPLGIDAEVEGVPLPYPATKLDSLNYVVVKDCKLNGVKTTKEALSE